LIKFDLSLRERRVFFYGERMKLLPCVFSPSEAVERRLKATVGTESGTEILELRGREGLKLWKSRLKSGQSDF